MLHLNNAGHVGGFSGLSTFHRGFTAERLRQHGECCGEHTEQPREPAAALNRVAGDLFRGALC
jgi:hypothetical protein